MRVINFTLQLPDLIYMINISVSGIPHTLTTNYFVWIYMTKKCRTSLDSYVGGNVYVRYYLKHLNTGCL